MAGKNPYDLVVSLIRRGGVGILPTDTIYGIVGAASNEKTVKKIYRLRRRNPKKPMIILIGDIRDLSRFGVILSSADKEILKKIWPGKVSVILQVRKNKKAALKYLHRGTGALAFRLPASRQLRDFLKKTGPIVAPSANFEGESPAKTIKEAKRYFSDSVDFYIDAGRRVSKPSTLIEIVNGTVNILRKGAVRIRGLV